MAGETETLWSYLWEGAQDLSISVTSHFKRKDKEGLRGASRAARAAANATVPNVMIEEEQDLLDLPRLRLQERFPNLASVVLASRGPKGHLFGTLCDGDATTFIRFVSETLAKLPRLTKVDLTFCDGLDALSVCTALVQCSQLQELSIPQGGKMCQAALAALAQLTHLSHLEMKHTEQLDLQGLKQLSSSLQQLQHLNLTLGRDVTDEAVACLTQLKALTALDLTACDPMRGSMLGQLAALSGLQELNLSHCVLTTLKGLELLPALQCLRLPHVELPPAALAPLSALTTLTMLEAAGAHITDECSALLRLPSLAWLIVGSILLAAPPAAGVLQQLAHLHMHISGSLASLLPLPKLQDLHLDHEAHISARLVALIAQQTSLTELVLWRMTDQHMQQMVAPLKQLQSFSAAFDPDETSCLAACTALAELPLLRELKLLSMPQPASLALLVRCTQLEELTFTLGRDVVDVGTGLLVALLCKPGMHWLHYYLYGSGASVDEELLAQVAARAGVALACDPFVHGAVMSVRNSFDMCTQTIARAACLCGTGGAVHVASAPAMACFQVKVVKARWRWCCDGLRAGRLLGCVGWMDDGDMCDAACLRVEGACMASGWQCGQACMYAN